MSDRLPTFLCQRRICIICEGDEEYEYIEKLKSLHVWNSQYKILTVNAKGNGNIPARYQDKYQNGSYEAVFVFCDTDRKPYEQYEEIKSKINAIHGIDNAAERVVIFGNPCTMQIIILHWEDIILTSHKKNKNADTIQRNLGIKGYKAREDQRYQVFEQIDKQNYMLMKERVKKLSPNDIEIGSSNFITLIDNLSSSEDTWIDELNNFLG